MSAIMKFVILLLTTCLWVVKGQFFGQPYSPYTNTYFNPGFGHNIFPQSHYASYPSFPTRAISPFSAPRYPLHYTPSPYVPQYFPLYYPPPPGYFPVAPPFGAGNGQVKPGGPSTQGTTTAVSKPAGSPSTSVTTPSGSSTTSATESPVTGDEDTVSVEAAS